MPATAQPIAFRSVESKAVRNVAASGDGDLIIQGWAARFTGTDREGEQFAESAFTDAIERAKAGTIPLAYHHKHDSILGRVLSLQIVKGVGLWMVARVDGALRSHPTLRTVYEQIKRGTINALSVGGFFKCGIGALANKIVGVDVTEISATGVPVMAPGETGTSFTVAAGKALRDPVATLSDERDAILAGLRDTAWRARVEALSATIDRALLGLPV
jgi:HK97 family phage prohead protease